MIIELFPVLAGDKEEQEEHVDDGEQPTGNPQFLTLNARQLFSTSLRQRQNAAQLARHYILTTRKQRRSPTNAARAHPPYPNLTGCRPLGPIIVCPRRRPAAWSDPPYQRH